MKKDIEKAIKKLIDKFKTNPDIFLTEDDLRAYFYSLLLPKFGKINKTADRSKSIDLHTEVRWYGNSGRQKYRSDIVIFNSKKLNTHDTIRTKMPSKGYSFNEAYFIIELKLRRRSGEGDKSFNNRIKKDREKIIELREDLSSNNSQPEYYLLIFDKKHLSLETSSDERFTERYISTNNHYNKLSNIA